MTEEKRNLMFGNSFDTHIEEFKNGFLVKNINGKDKDNNKNTDIDREHEDRETYGVRDALGKYDYAHSAKRDDSPIKQNYRVSPLALSHFDSMKKHYDKKERRMLNEVEDLENHLKEKPAKSK